LLKESATLANRLIEGQVLNAHYAEESYQLKRDNCHLKKQIDDTINNERRPTNLSHRSDFLVPNPDDTDDNIDRLRETIQRLTLVCRICHRTNASIPKSSMFMVDFIGESSSKIVVSC
jgi:hypothetical protein